MSSVLFFDDDDDERFKVVNMIDLVLFVVSGKEYPFTFYVFSLSGRD